jgi:hypothetical protein
MSEPQIARRYHADKNPDGNGLPGVPLRDLTVDDWAALPAWLQQSIDGWSAYSVAKGGPPKAEPTAQE